MNFQKILVCALSALILVCGIHLARAASDIVRSNGNITVTLTTAACDDPKVTQYLVPGAAAQFRLASVVEDGKEFVGCYAVHQGEVFVVDETGDHGFLDSSFVLVEII